MDELEGRWAGLKSELKGDLFCIDAYQQVPRPSAVDGSKSTCHRILLHLVIYSWNRGNMVMCRRHVIARRTLTTAGALAASVSLRSTLSMQWEIWPWRVAHRMKDLDESFVGLARHDSFGSLNACTPTEVYGYNEA